MIGTVDEIERLERWRVLLLDVGVCQHPLKDLQPRPIADVRVAPRNEDGPSRSIAVQFSLRLSIRRADFEDPAKRCLPALDSRRASSAPRMRSGVCAEYIRAPTCHVPF